jgi:serine/threonine-protein kinase SRPK3
MVLTSILSSGASRLKSILGRAPKQLQTIRPTSEESIGRYCDGGYHPVRIGDLFSDGKYRIVSKLGYGVYSTVWLACNTR